MYVIIIIPALCTIVLANNVSKSARLELRYVRLETRLVRMFFSCSSLTVAARLASAAAWADTSAAVVLALTF